MQCVETYTTIRRSDHNNTFIDITGPFNVRDTLRTTRVGAMQNHGTVFMDGTGTLRICALMYRWYIPYLQVTSDSKSNVSSRNG